MDKQCLSKRLPIIELSYGKHLHKKVHADIYQIRPKGSKCLLWYTYFGSENSCYLLYLNNDLSKIYKFEKITTFFSDELSIGQGTLLSGILYKNKFSYFAITDFHYYKGQNINKLNFLEKYEFLHHYLNNEINQSIFITSQLIIASCILVTNHNDAVSTINNLSYQVNQLGLISLKKSYVLGTLNYNHFPKSVAIFNVKPELNFDTYNLYTDNNIFYSKALIPGVKTSFKMNKLFRNIKENDNLDLLEESDSEEEFENNNIDKYVYLDKICKMKCVFNTRFKKWQPIELSEQPITPKPQILSSEKKSLQYIYESTSQSRIMGKYQKYR